MKKLSYLLCLTFTTLLFQAPVNATLITVAPAGSTVVDFSQFPSFASIGSGIEVGSLVGESITLSSTSGFSGISYNGYGLGSNGGWSSAGRNGYVGLNSSSGHMDFIFNDGPVQSVGGFVNYAPGNGNPLIEALDNLGQVIESWNLNSHAPINTPSNSNELGAFRGISRLTNDIFGLRMSNAYVVLDDLTFSRVSSLPEPGTLVLIGIGLLGLGFNRRKKP